VHKLTHDSAVFSVAAVTVLVPVFCLSVKHVEKRNILRSFSEAVEEPNILGKNNVVATNAPVSNKNVSEFTRLGLAGRWGEQKQKKTQVSKP
jgi:hypothetical protein